MEYRTIISTEELDRHLEDQNWVVVDCRFDLSSPEWGFAEYQISHIQGAVFADLNRDLSSTVTESTGRHPLPEPDFFLEKLSSWGIQPTTQLVAYDSVGGAFAARFWCLMRMFKHQKVALLDGGWQKWQREERPVSSGIDHRQKAQYVGEFSPDLIVDASEIERMRKNPHSVVIDARSPERYRGESEPIDPVAGRIPGALNRFHSENLQPDLTFKPASILREEFEHLLMGKNPNNSAVYCGSGVTSCLHLIAMEHAGIKGARLYAGSWSEWIRDPKRPIDRD